MATTTDELKTASQRQSQSQERQGEQEDQRARLEREVQLDVPLALIRKVCPIFLLDSHETWYPRSVESALPFARLWKAAQASDSVSSASGLVPQRLVANYGRVTAATLGENRGDFITIDLEAAPGAALDPEAPLYYHVIVNDGDHSIVPAPGAVASMADGAIETVPDPSVLSDLLTIKFIWYCANNPPYRVLGCIPAGAHMSDWEGVVVQVNRKTEAIVRLCFTRHGDAECVWREWKDVERRRWSAFTFKGIPSPPPPPAAPATASPGASANAGSTAAANEEKKNDTGAEEDEDEVERPVVYIARDAHGAYEDAGTFLRLAGFANDHCDGQVPWRPRSFVSLDDPASAPPWVRYTGSWDAKRSLPGPSQHGWWASTPRTSATLCYRLCSCLPAWLTRCCLRKLPYDLLAVPSP